MGFLLNLFTEIHKLVFMCFGLCPEFNNGSVLSTLFGILFLCQNLNIFNTFKYGEIN